MRTVLLYLAVLVAMVLAAFVGYLVWLLVLIKAMH